MKKRHSERVARARPQSDDVAPEYDLDSLPRGVRGKYRDAYAAGHTVRVTRDDGTVEVRHFELEDGAVLLEPDVLAHFPDSASVNRALRCLIPLEARPKSPIRLESASVSGVIFDLFRARGTSPGILARSDSCDLRRDRLFGRASSAGEAEAQTAVPDAQLVGGLRGGVSTQVFRLSGVQVFRGLLHREGC